jgi:hypothetical protein
MRCRTILGVILFSLVASQVPVRAEELQGRARTWDIEPMVGFSVLDTGFDRNLLGYDLQAGGSKIPPTTADHLDTMVPTFGARFGYSFTRYFALELTTLAGTTQVGEDTQIILEENFATKSPQRQINLQQQTAAAPRILAAYDTLDFDYTNSNMVGVFKFNNAKTSKVVFYGTLGGGYFALNPDTAAWNDCRGGDDVLVFDPTIDPYNGDPDDPFNPDLFEDNPDQLRVDPGCNRAFATSTLVNGEMVEGSRFQDTTPVTSNAFLCPDGENQTVDLDTGQIFCDGSPQWEVEPGTLADRGFSTINKVNGFEDFFYSIGGGFRWHVKPRHVLRVDAKRHFIETRNKNINEFSFGWSFVLGRGKPDMDAAAAPPPMDNDEVPPPADDAGADGLS